jgi:anti-anti-sigma factor
MHSDTRRGNETTPAGSHEVGVAAETGPAWLAVLRDDDGWVIRPLKNTLLGCDPDQFVRQVERLVAAGGRRFTIQLAAVDDIDGACVGGLARSYRIIHESGGTLRLAGLHPRVRALLDLAGVTRWVSVEDEIPGLGPAAARGGHRLDVSRCA